MNSLRSYILPVVFLAILAGVIFGTFSIGKSATKQQKAEVVDCQTKGSTHTVEVKNDQITPESISATVCDELTIINKDDKLRLMAFGVHDAHIYYNGVTEKILKKDEGLTVTLNQTGTYIFHDHLQDDVQGQFNVR